MEFNYYCDYQVLKLIKVPLVPKMLLKINKRILEE